MKDHNDNNNDNKEEEEDKLETIIHDEKSDVKVTSDDVKEAIIDKPLSSSVMESGGTNLDAEIGEAFVLGAVAISPSAQALPRLTRDVSFDGRNDEVDSYLDGENVNVMMEVDVPTREHKCAIGQNEIERYVAEMHQIGNCLDDDDGEVLIPDAFLVDDNPDDAVIVVDGQVRNV